MKGDRPSFIAVDDMVADVERRDSHALAILQTLIPLGAKPLNEYPARVIPVMVKVAFDIADAFMAEGLNRRKGRK